MTKFLAMLLALVLVLGIVACGNDMSVEPTDRIGIPPKDKMCPEYLEDKGYYYGFHAEEGDIYLFASWLYAVSEEGEVRLLHDQILMVTDMEFTYCDPETKVLYQDKILGLNTNGKLVFYTGESWLRVGG